MGTISRIDELTVFGSDPVQIEHHAFYDSITLDSQKPRDLYATFSAEGATGE